MTAKKNRSGATRSKAPQLKAVTTPMGADSGAESVMARIDEVGAPPMPLPEFIDMLEEIIAQCRTRIAAARDDLKR